MKNLQSLISLQGCSGRNVGQSAAKHGNDTTTTRNRHVVGPHLFRTVLLLLTFLTLGVGEMWADATSWKIKGTGTNLNGWDGSTAMTQSTTNTAVWYKQVSGTCEFKIVGSTGNWGDNEKGNGDIANDYGNITLSNSSGNIKGIPSGSWYICYHATDGKVYGTTTNPNYPDMVIVGNDFGSIGDWSTTNTVMTSNGSGTYTKTISSVGGATDCQFKIAYKGTWTGAKGHYTSKVSGTNCTPTGDNGGGNISFSPIITGDVTITYTQSSGAITITCPTPTWTSIYVYNDASFADMYLYTFDDVLNGPWPGTKSTYVTSLGSNWYEVKILTGATKFILNDNSSKQTTDVTTSGLTGGRSYHFKANSTKYDLEEYKLTVSFNMKSHGSAVSNQNIYYNGLVSEPSTPSATGYTFGGWYKETGCTNAWNFSSDKVTASTTLYAKWTAKTTTISLNLNGGTSGATSVTATYDATLPSFTLATRTGSYNLTGYWTESSGGTKVINADGTFAANSGIWNRTDGSTLTLYAQWSSFLTVTYDGNGNTGGTAPTDANEYSSGATVTVKAKPDGLVKTGYSFTGWKAGGVTYTAGQTFTITANTTLVAQWSENTYTVTISGGTASTTTAGISTTGTATVSLPAGKKFTGWELGTGVTLVTGTASSTTITFHASQASTVTATFANRAGVKMYFAKPASWSTSVKAYAWKGEDRNADWPGVAITTETYNCVEYYTYQYYTEGDGIGNPATGKSTWDQIVFNDNGSSTNKTGDLTIADGHIYHWSSSGTGLTTGSDWYVEGSFNSVEHWNDADYPIIFDACGNTGTVTISGLTATAQQFKIYRLSTDTWYRYSTAALPLNTEVTLVSTDGDNNTFTPLATADFTFTLDITTPASPKLTVAAVDATSYSATLAVNGNGSTSPAAGNITLHQITPTYITATPDEGYYFVNWTVTGNAAVTSTTDNPTTASATGNGGTITANFTDKWNLKGDQWDNWNTYKPLPNTGTNTFGTTIDLVKGTKYQFKVVQRGASDTWYGNTNGAGNHVFSRGDGAFTTVADGMNNNLEITPDVSGTYTFSINTSGSTPKITITYQAAYTVTFGYGTGGSAVTASGSTDGAISSGNYVKAGDNVTFTQTPSSSGYTFNGWYTAASGGSAVSGMGTSDNVLDAIAANANVYAQYTANTYTVSFNVNGGTASTPDSKEVTFGSAYGTLPSGMTHASKVFKGWYTLSSGGTLVTSSTIVSTAGNHTLYAQYEDIYTVNIDYKCSGAKLRNSSSTHASATAVTAEITAPEILGYEFSNWSGSNITFVGSSTSATTTIHATAATTITANYTAIPTVYFKNNLGWEHVYVTFDCGWTDGSNNVPINNGKDYFEMEQLGTSDIFSCRIPDGIVSSWKGNIAFDNKGFGDYSSTHKGNSTGFNSGEFLGRGDFDPSATMFIPYNGDSETRNGGTYYRTGCWMKYNSTDPGYKLYANTHVSGPDGSAVAGTPVLLKADIAGGFEFKAKVNFGTANYTYGFMLHKEYTTNSDAIWYTNTSDIYASTTTLPWDFTTEGASENGRRCGLHTEATGDYEFTVSFGTGKPMVNVTYPVSTGDYRLSYNDRVAWSGDVHDADWHIESRVIKAKADAEDIVSFYVSKATGANASIELQKCTAIDPGTGAETWTKQSDVSLSEITSTGIYNFKVTQDGEMNATVTFDGGYDGNFYIRTDASDGGWANYKTSGTNTMTYSEYAAENHGFTHYFMRYVTVGSNIKFCIANDYSPCLTEYCVSDSYTNEWIEANGNIRFMWDHRTNAVSRAYISGSGIVSDRFLVLEGDENMFDENGDALTTAGGGKISGLNDHEMKFTDDQNWIYEATVHAIPGARIKLTAKYNNKIQYFYGAEGARLDATTEQLLGGEGDTQYKIRIVYDFKTNRLIKAFIPEGAIEDDLSIEADLMIIREAQEDAQQITFNGGSLEDVKTVYGAMKFNKYTVNNKAKDGGHGNLGWSQYKRDIFYISFPFDVKLSDAFGFGTYGKHWIIEYYDGKERAEKGFWADTKSFWKFVTPAQRSSFTMKAFEGYILALDLEEMTESSSVWNNGVEDVYVYFPSSEEVEDIQATNRLVEIDQEGYECTIGPRFEGGDDRTKKDSYWHVIGVPSFANYDRDLTVTNGGTAIDWSNGGGEIDWETPSFPYLYEWNSSDNSLTVTSSATFEFKATYSYMVQYAGTSIYWSQVNVTPSVVARRESTPMNVEFRLELQQGEQKADQAFIRMTNDEVVTTGFDFNYDLSKEFNKNKANIYTLVNTEFDEIASVTEAAGNVLPLSEQTTIVPVGVKIAANDDYTFTIPDGTSGVGVTLIDTETGVRTNLSALDYTVSLEAGTYNERFVMEISPIQQVITDVQASEINDQKSDVRKQLIDGLLYIVRDGKMYDARGAKVE